MQILKQVIVCVLGVGREEKEGCVEGRKYKSILIRIKATDSTIHFPPARTVTEALRSENHFLTVKCYSGTYTIIARASKYIYILPYDN